MKNDKIQNKVTVEVETNFNPDLIESTVFMKKPFNDMHEIMKHIVRLQDEGIKEALLKLGWTPPRIDSQWDYYQELCKSHGLSGITDAITQRNKLLEAAKKTLMENLHLCDGDNCTLYDLKTAVLSIDGNFFDETR